MSRSDNPRSFDGSNGNGLTLFMAASLRRRCEIVELDDRICLRPHAELARVLEGIVVLVDHLRAVQEDLDVVPDHLHGKLMPHARGDLAVPTGETDPAALDDGVEVPVD